MWYRLSDFFTDHRRGLAVVAAVVVVAAAAVAAFTLVGGSGSDESPQRHSQSSLPAVSSEVRELAAAVVVLPDASPRCVAAAKPIAEVVPDASGAAAVDAKTMGMFRRLCMREVDAVRTGD